MAFLNDRLQYNNGKWRITTLGKHIGIPVVLTENYDPSIDINNPKFDLVFKDEKGPNYNPDEFKESKEIYIINNSVISKDSNVLKTTQLKSLDTSVLTQLNAIEGRPCTT